MYQKLGFLIAFLSRLFYLLFYHFLAITKPRISRLSILFYTILSKSLTTEYSSGGVVEWFKALVLKTSVSARVPWVRIPPPPFLKFIFKFSF